MHHDQILDAIWESLRAATTQRTGFTLATLATVTAAGQPRARAVIIREFVADPEGVCFATDSRSAKVEELRAQPRVALAFYDDTRSVQFRAEGVAHIVDDPTERHRAWDTLPPHSCELYAAAAIPGAPLAQADVSDGRTVFERFTWVSIRFEYLDWLDLSADPHQRWQFQRQGATWAGRRVVP